MTVYLRIKTRTQCQAIVDGVAVLPCAWCEANLQHSFTPHPVGGGRYVPLCQSCHAEHAGGDLLQARALEYLEERGL